MNAHQIYCPNCDRKVPAVNINIVEMMGKCTGCDHVFSLKDQTANAGGSVTLTNTTSAPSRPSGITHDVGAGGEVLIKRSWFHPSLFFLLFFCIAWDGFLVFWYSMAFFGPQQGGFEWIMVLFPICHVAVGIGLTYYVIAGFLNRTEIFISHVGLYVRHRPIPWRGNRDLQRDEILEIELDLNSASHNDSRGLQMSICAHHEDGRQVVLISSMPVRQAEYVAWHIADVLEVPIVRNSHNRPASVNVPQWLKGIIPTSK